MYHSVERFCSDICQVYFAIHLLINLAYHRSAVGYYRGLFIYSLFFQLSGGDVCGPSWNNVM